MIDIHYPTFYDIDYICKNMRETDWIEVSGVGFINDKEDYSSKMTSIINGPCICRVAVPDDLTPVAMFGIVWTAPGVGTAFLVATDRWREVALSVSKRVRRFLDNRVEAHRIQAIVLSDNIKAKRLLEFMSFRKESTLSMFGRNKQDYEMWVRTYDRQERHS